MSEVRAAAFLVFFWHCVKTPEAAAQAAAAFEMAAFAC
jgi:hypothetical protein